MWHIYRELTTPVTTTILDRIAAALNVDVFYCWKVPPLPKTLESEGDNDDGSDEVV